MKDFIFHIPTKIVFGRGVFRDIGSYAALYGRRILLVAGSGSARRNGTLEGVIDSLKAANLDISLLEGVVSNPLLSKVREGISIARDRNVDTLVALGGGSVIDTAKAIAAGCLLEKGDIWDVFTCKQEIGKALPLLTVPTIAASGSEMNGYMVITNEKTRNKLASASPHIQPKVSLLDPEITFSVPKDYTAYGGIDAVCHLLEPFFNSSCSDTVLQDRIAASLIKTIMEATARACDVPDDYNARAQLMWGASLALCGLTKAGVGDHIFFMHLIEHSISALFNVAHGAGLAAIIPGWLTWKALSDPDRVLHLGKLLWPCEEMDSYRTTVDNLVSWMSSLEAPVCLADLGITVNNHEEIADNIMVQVNLRWNRGPVSKEVILKILNHCQ